MNNLAIMPRSDFDVLKEQAGILLESGFLPKAIDTPQKAIAIAMHGAELGIPIWTALNNINVIQGKPTASPQLMLALINRSGQLEDMTIDVDDERAVVTMKRRGRTAHTEVFSMADARQMQTTEYVNGQKRTIPLADKYNWKQMPQTMMKWRAVAACARIVFPDAILGLYTPEEMGADVSVDGEGNMQVIEIKREVPAPTPQLVEKVTNTDIGEIIQPAPTVVEPANPLLDEPPPDPTTDADTAFDSIRTGEPEQPALGLVDTPKVDGRKWVIGTVKEHAILHKEYITGGGITEHFDALIKSLYDKGRISDNTTTEGVIAEIDLHYADGHHLKNRKERKSA